MRHALRRFLNDDRFRLEALLAGTFRSRGEIDDGSYTEFRAALLRRIAMDKLILPALERAGAGKQRPSAARLELDHLALTSLLVPPPTLVILTAIRAILATYDAREAEPGGLYEACDRLTGDEAGSLLAALRAMPDPPVPPHANGRESMNAVRRALTRAGYDLHDYEPA
jgi:hypothetical protein